MFRNEMRIVACSLCALLAACHARGNQPQPGHPKDQRSYSLGYQTGSNLRTERITVVTDDYLAGVRDAVAGAQPRVNQSEINAAVAEVRRQVVVGRKAAAKEKAEKNLADGKAFRTKNRTNEGVKALPSGLAYKVLKQGAGRTPRTGDTVTLNYRSRHIDGVEFASSAKYGKPVSVGLEQVIPGWKEALLLMPEGSRWELVVPPELAYGARGAPGVEPNSTLVFEVELVTVAPGAKGKGLTMR
jgi:FKBP-type peptidyl-prolyl cis-trans isomerase